MNKKIIIIEDEKSISDTLTLVLEDEGYDVTVYDKGKAGLKKYQEHHLLVLDLMLPDMNGLDILQEIRKVDATFPILITSAKSTEDDIVKGLELGADDYVVKPFSIKELILRIKRTLQRKELLQATVQKEKSLSSFNFKNGLLIDFTTLQATTKLGKKQLTTQEASILSYMISHADEPISRDNLLKEIWGHNRSIETRTIDNFIVRFRKYFEDNPKKPNYFITQRGIGYKFSL